MRDGLVSELVRTVSRFAIVGVVGGLAGACSSDTLRFTETPFGNPFASGQSDPAQTASVDRPAATARVKRSTVSSAPLAAPAPNASASPKVAAAAPAYNRPAPVGAAPSRPASSGGSPGWSAEGGTAITVSQGDTLNTISNRYGVPSGAILAANGLSAAQVVPGRRIMIPVYSATGGASRAPQQVAQAAPVAPPPAHGKVVARAKLADAKPEAALATKAAAPVPGTKVRPGQAAKVAEPVRVAKAADPKTMPEPKTTASVEPKTRVRPGQVKTAEVQPAAKPAPGKEMPKLAKPEAKTEKPATVGKLVKSEPLPAPQPKVAKAEPAPAAPKPVKAEPAKPEPQPAKAAGKPVAAAPKVAAVEPAKPAEPAKPSREPESTGALPAQPAAPTPEFRWPARGRVISGFGGSGANEGINIAVPDGTPVKAAESGTVAYAGSEVKGYGNLVLIRHDNGYVSAYAHNGDIEVKRGQKVSRGQTIAKSGQTGNVTSPQLHFEIRKGSTPVDPMPHLASN